MIKKPFYISIEDLRALVDAPRPPKGDKDFKGFVFRLGYKPLASKEVVVTLFPDAVYSNADEPTGDDRNDEIQETGETPVCPYPPGYGKKEE